MKSSRPFASKINTLKTHYEFGAFNNDKMSKNSPTKKEGANSSLYCFFTHDNRKTNLLSISDNTRKSHHNTKINPPMPNNRPVIKNITVSQPQIPMYTDETTINLFDPILMSNKEKNKLAPEKKDYLSFLKKHALFFRKVTPINDAAC